MKLTRRLLTFALILTANLAGAAPRTKLDYGTQLPEGEKAIYMRLIEAYRSSSIKDTYKFRDMMLKRYPKSVYADNALYLAGLLDFQKGRIAESIQNYSELIRRYPQANKKVSALYAKSAAYTKLNLPQISKKILEEIVSKYPGSPESQRAWIELRLREKSS